MKEISGRGSSLESHFSSRNFEVFVSDFIFVCKKKNITTKVIMEVQSAHLLCTAANTFIYKQI